MNNPSRTRPVPVATAVDWAEVQSRLEAARRALELNETPSHEEARKVLQARARALARQPEKEKPAENHLEVVAFLLAHEAYGLETSYVREVYPIKDLVAVPCTPAFVLGMVNLRGQILSIIDLKKFFDLPEKGLTDLNKALVIRAGPIEVGILADAILGVRAISAGELQATLPTLTGIRAEYLHGVTSDRLVILDAGKILSDPRIRVHEEVEAQK